MDKVRSLNSLMVAFNLGLCQLNRVNEHFHCLCGCAIRYEQMESLFHQRHRRFWFEHNSEMVETIYRYSAIEQCTYKAILFISEQWSKM